MVADDLVNVLVPKRHLSQVYGLIAKLDATGVSSASENAAEDGAEADGPAASGEWTQMRLRKMLEQSPPAMLDILKELASRPGEWLTTADLARAIKSKPDADWNTVAGTLGAFGRRVKNRYALESWPFENRRDYEIGGRVCAMNADMARRIKKLLSELNR